MCRQRYIPKYKVQPIVLSGWLCEKLFDKIGYRTKFQEQDRKREKQNNRPTTACKNSAELPKNKGLKLLQEEMHGCKNNAEKQNSERRWRFSVSCLNGSDIRRTRTTSITKEVWSFHIHNERSMTMDAKLRWVFFLHDGFLKHVPGAGETTTTL